MKWLSTESVVAVATTVLSIVASAGMVWYERRVPRSKRIGYRVQLNSPIGEGAADNLNRRLGLFDEAPDMADATLVLLRIENDGMQDIDRDDYTGPEQHGLTAVFTDRTVRGVSVTQPNNSRHLMEHFAPDRGFGYTGSRLRIPRVPLNKKEHFKLLVLLSGGGVDRPIEVTGGIRGGQVHPNHSVTLDETPPLFSRAARLITILLTLCVITLSTIVLTRAPLPSTCATGTLTLTGSTAFQPVLEEAAKRYESECPGSTIKLELHGSVAGLRELRDKGAGEGSPSMIAFSDTPEQGEGLTGLKPTWIALSVYALVVSDKPDPKTGAKVDVRNLEPKQIQKLYRGETAYWDEDGLGGPHLAVHLVSRDASSGTRQVLQRRVLGQDEMAHTSLDCEKPDFPGSVSEVPRCELDSTGQVLDQVANTPGAIGYSELKLAEAHKGVHILSIGHQVPSAAVIENGKSSYPYREVEYAYTYGTPPAGSLVAGFRTYLSEAQGEDVISAKGHIPCWTSIGRTLCQEWEAKPLPTPTGTP